MNALVAIDFGLTPPTQEQVEVLASALSKEERHPLLPQT